MSTFKTKRGGVSFANVKEFYATKFFEQLEDALTKVNIDILRAKKLNGLTVYNGKRLKEFEVPLDDGQILSFFVDSKTGQLASMEIDGKAAYDFDDSFAGGTMGKLIKIIQKRSRIVVKQQMMSKVDIVDKVGLDRDLDKAQEMAALEESISNAKKEIKKLKAGA